jgi:hypothetical protein
MISRQIAIVEPYENPNLDNPNLDNPNLSNQGTSQIVNIPVDYPISVNVPNVPNVPVNLGNNNLVDLEIQPINTPTASTITSPTASTTTSTTTSPTASTTTSTTTSPTASTTTSPTASTTTSPIGSKKAKSSKNMQYLIYGGGALAVIIVYKLLFSNKEN